MLSFGKILWGGYMYSNKIIIKGARENNLKNIDLELPKNSLIVFTGLSGSGKSTLAFNTIYSEGQRRYVESLSSYARQFLGGIEKPDVDSIDGLSPSIAIDQKTTSHNPRSTVGTVTEIYDYLRLLFARVGHPYCPEHGCLIEAFTPNQIVDCIYKNENNARIQILAPVIHREKGTHKDTLDKIRSQGFERLRIDGEICTFDELPELDKNKTHYIDIIIDRIVLKPEARSRIFEAVELALDWAHGYVIVLNGKDEELYSEHHACPQCGFSVPPLEPRLFSFNAPLGNCNECNGLGIKREVDLRLLVPNENLSLNQGAIVYQKGIVGTTNLEWKEFVYLCNAYDIPMDIPYKELTTEQRQIILYGSPKEHSFVLKSGSGNTVNRRGFIEGVKVKIERLYQETSSDFMRTWYESFMRDHVCESCHGARLNEKVLSVKVGGLNIYEMTCLSTGELLKFINNLTLPPMEQEIARLVIAEIKNRLEFLVEVGLEYLTLSRMAMTLSGGEAQRIRLATQIGSKLSGVLYVLDEPSIGLHQRDNDRLIHSLKEMRDLGNTLIVVEHDEDTMRAADHIVDIGPRAGIHGGEVVAQGTIDDIINSPRSITGDYLAGRKFIHVPALRKSPTNKKITIKGARCNNLKNINVDFPLGLFICVTGVSGSGKSSLVTETLYKHVHNYFTNGKLEEAGECDEILGLQYIDKVINIEQDPIGKTPRSNPATYTGVFDDIRNLFASTTEARIKGYDKSRFSFNVKGGRCEKCQGTGVIRIPMNFLPDVYVTCTECNGHRYNEETLACTYKGKNIFDVLNMTIEEAYEFFENIPTIARTLRTLNQVGLGYITLGQAATTLSGGEAQRVKLANELQKVSTGKTLYILDEPTTGLHIDDVSRLIEILQTIVNNGDTVVVIEHNLDLIKVADYIIDIGPEGGDGGGTIVAAGSPEEICEVEKSYTGQYLKKYLFKNK